MEARGLCVPASRRVCLCRGRLAPVICVPEGRKVQRGPDGSQGGIHRPVVFICPLWRITFANPAATFPAYWAIPIRRVPISFGPGRIPGPSFCPYSPECVEVAFSEVRHSNLRRRSRRDGGHHAVSRTTRSTSANVATNAVRKRAKRLRLATDELPREFWESPSCGGLAPSEWGNGYRARTSF